MQIVSNTIKRFWFPIFCGIIVTFWKYEFGVSDQLDHLLFIKKALNKDFLTNDFYVSGIADYSLRFYYAHFVAIFAKFLGIPLTCFLITLLANMLTAFATFLVAVQISKSSLAAQIACITVLTISTINMGDVTTIYATGIAPDRLAFPLVLLAFYYALKIKPLALATIGGIASIFHIMLGVFIPMVILFVLFLVNWQNNKYKNLATFIKAGLILFGFSLLTLIPFGMQNLTSIPSKEFIETFAFFRVPHHLVPSHIFANGIGIRSIIFLFGGTLTIYLFYKEKLTNISNSKLCLFLVIVFALLCFIGYLFIELVPSRIGVMVQAFRYLTFVKWLLLLLVSSYAGVLLQKRETFISGLYIYLSVLSPILMCFALVYRVISLTNISLVEKIKFKSLIGLVIIISYLLLKATNPETGIYIAWLALVLFLFKLSPKLKILPISIVLVLVLVKSFFIDLPTNNNSWFSKNFNPVFNYTANAKNNMAYKVKELTSEKTLLIAPADFTQIRTIGERASVVCFKTVPFTDLNLREWKSRLDFCYGKTSKLGFKAEQELVEFYKEIPDEHLLKIKEKYGVTHAVLFNETKTSFKILYSNSTYKLVTIE